MEEKQNQVQEKSLKLTRQEKISFAMLCFLYFLQGLVIVIPSTVFTVLLAEQGAKYSEMAMIQSCFIAFSFKIVYSPLQEIYYFQKIGKRKTYILLSNLIIGIMFLFYSSQAQELIIAKDTYSIGIFCVIVVFMLALADVSIDGWVTSLFSPEKRGNGSVCQSLGLSCGVIITANVFMELSSDKFCKKYFSLENKLITLEGYMKLIGGLYLISTSYLFLFQKEIDSTDKLNNLRQILFCLKKFIQKSEIRFICFIFAFYRVGFTTIDSSVHLNLIKRGFPKETWVWIRFMMTPISIFVPIIYRKYIQNQLIDMKIFIFCLIIKTIDSIVQGFGLYFYQGPGEGGLLLYVFFFNQLIQKFVGELLFIVLGSYVFRISDPAIGGVYITAMFCFMLIGKFCLEPFGLILLDYLPFNFCYCFGIIYEIVFIIATFKKIMRIDSQNIDVYIISDVKEEKKND